jgi:hypothetical protein
MRGFDFVARRKALAPPGLWKGLRLRMVGLFLLQDATIRDRVRGGVGFGVRFGVGFGVRVGARGRACLFVRALVRDELLLTHVDLQW